MTIRRLSLIVTLAVPMGLGVTTLTAAPANTAAMASTQPVRQISADDQTHVDELTRSYLTIQHQLAQDKLEGVADDLKAVVRQANALADSDSALAREAKAVGAAADPKPRTLEEARATFKKLSLAVANLLSTAPPTTDVAPALFQVHCPMAKASWLQDSKDVANPYLGQAMVTCGSVQHTIRSRSN